MAYVLAGAALSRLVLATDCSDADEHDITELYAERSEHEISDGLRWFYCCGLGIALLSMSVIAVSHVHKEFEGQRLKKSFRLIVRLAVAVILICLPLAHELTSLGLIATTTCLVVLVLAVDIWGSTDKNEVFWRCNNACKYSADCQIKRKSIVDALKRGEKVELKNNKDLEKAAEKAMYE